MKKYKLSISIIFSSILVVSLLGIGCSGVKKDLQEKAVLEKGVDENQKSEYIDPKEQKQDNVNAELDTSDKKEEPALKKETKSKKPDNKIKHDFIQDAKNRYKNLNIVKVVKTDSIQYLKTRSEKHNSAEHLLLYSADGQFLKEIDLKGKNPYKQYVSFDRSDNNHQYIRGYNKNIGDTKIAVKDQIPEKLYKYTPNNFYISSISPHTEIASSPNGEYLYIKYYYHLLPGHEILEHVTYPGINSYDIINTKTGETINRLEDLPFIPYGETLTNDGKYLIIAHTQDITSPTFSVEDEDWKHQASIYSVNSGELCFRKEGRDECSYIHSTYKKGAVIFISGLQCFDQHGFGESAQDTIINYFVKDEFIIARKVSLKEGHPFTKSTKEYEAIRRLDNSMIKYYYEKDYEKIQRLCN